MVLTLCRTEKPNLDLQLQLLAAADAVASKDLQAVAALVVALEVVQWAEVAMADRSTSLTFVTKSHFLISHVQAY